MYQIIKNHSMIIINRISFMKKYNINYSYIKKIQKINSMEWICYLSIGYLTFKILI